MAAEDRELVFDHRGVAENIAGIREPRDDAQRELLTAAADHDWRMRLLHRLRLQDRVFDAEPAAAERGALLGPHGEDQPQGLFHLPDADGRLRRKLVAVLAIFGFVPAGA